MVSKHLWCAENALVWQNGIKDRFFLKNKFCLAFPPVCRPAAGQGGNEPFGALVGAEDSHDESYGNNSKDSTLMMREVRTSASSHHIT